MKYKFPIETERISMRLLTMDDMEEWTIFFIDNPQLHFVGVKEEKPPHEHAEFWLNRQIKRYHDTGLGMLGMVEKSSGRLIGQVGIIQRDINNKLYHEIGYGIIPEKWGQGFASEGAIRMKKYLIEHKLDTKVISMIAFENIGSQKVAENNGMHRAFEYAFEGDPCYIYQQDLV